MNICENCGKSTETLNWGGNHDSVSLARNSSLIKQWCELCITRYQINYATEQMDRLPELKEKLIRLVRNDK